MNSIVRPLLLIIASNIILSDACSQAFNSVKEINANPEFPYANEPFELIISGGASQGTIYVESVEHFTFLKRIDIFLNFIEADAGPTSPYLWERTITIPPHDPGEYTIVATERRIGGGHIKVLHTSTLRIPDILSTRDKIDKSPIELYPNPVSDAGIISFTGKQNESVDIKITTLDGKSIETIYVPKSAVEKSELTYHFGHLSPGIYLLNLVVGGKKMSTKIIRK